MEEKTCAARLMHYLKRVEKLQRLKRSYLTIRQPKSSTKQWAGLRQKAHQLSRLEEKVIEKINALPLAELKQLPLVEKKKTLRKVKAQQEQWRVHSTILEQREAVVRECLQCFVSPCYTPKKSLGPLLVRKQAVSSA